MRRFLETFALVVGLLAWSGMACAQGWGRWGGPGGSVHAGRGVHGRWRGSAPPGWGRAPAFQNPGVGFSVQSGSGGMFFGFSGIQAPVGTVTDPGFAVRLGNTVGLSVFPPGTMPPGVGNINHPGMHPGMQPLPIAPQPLPTALPFPVPNINYPGGIPGIQGPSQHGSGGHFYGRGQNPSVGFGPIIYGVPYGVPYYVPVYTEVIPTTPAEQPNTYKGPYGAPETPFAQPPPEPQQPPAAPQAGRPVTLLAFKDHTIIAVTDYWLEGDVLVYETSPGMQVRIPLDRLDLVLTQQFNRERNVRFVLEARP